MKNKKEKTNLRKFLFMLPLLLLTLITTVAVTFAWWNTLTVKKDVTGKVGDSVVLTLTAADFNGVLVPKNAIVKGSAEDIFNQDLVEEWSTDLNFNIRDTSGEDFVLTITSVEIFVDEVDRSSYFDCKIDDVEYDPNTSYNFESDNTLELNLKLSFRDINPTEQDFVRTTFAGKELTVKITATIAQP